ncbi:MAG: monothiol glutaredoxin grx4 [Claussenomyces sp. TS43310]|nr:MAG: monothiol glutaredoxin grx4 [Claussenomyces sp. TS43310]
MSKVDEITEESAFQAHLQSLPPSTLLILSFYAPWAAPCAQMNVVLRTLAQSYPATNPPTTSWLSINAEELPDISENYDVSAVPYLVLVRDKKVLETVSGSDATRVREAIEKHTSINTRKNAYGDDEPLPPMQEPSSRDSSIVKPATKDLSSYAPTARDPKTGPDFSSDELAKTGATSTTEKADLTKRLTELVKAAPVMLFMKGTPSAPQCGFSRQLVGLLRENSVRYGFFNILADDDVRQGLKEFADWPTFPQLWVEGELVGGLDIVKEEVANNPEFFEGHSTKGSSGTGITA